VYSVTEAPVYTACDGEGNYDPVSVENKIRREKMVCSEAVLFICDNKNDKLKEETPAVASLVKMCVNYSLDCSTEDSAWKI
jgi:hypothetical protein